MFPGLDVDSWDSRLIWLWQWSNLRHVGFYLAHHVGTEGTVTSWTTHLHDLRDAGWAVTPFWLPFGDSEVATAMPAANGTNHGRIAAANARNARLERGATIYLDIENAIDLGNHSPFLPYISDWMRAVRAAGYAPGVYCSRLNAGAILNRAEFRPFEPVVWAIAVHGSTRAQWDNTNFQLASLAASDWPVSDAPADPAPWASSNMAVGTQYDWFNADRDRHGFNWPTADGQQSDFRSVDWDMAKCFDPSHPTAAATVALAQDFDDPERCYALSVGTGILGSFERTSAGRFANQIELQLSESDIGPQAAAASAGFDAAFAAATSRGHGNCDFFLLGQDGFLRTLWINPQERFPRHPWALNPQNPARRGSPIAAVSRTLNQIDLFYVDRDHHLVTQWWSPDVTQWDRRRVLPEPAGANQARLVAGGSNLAALPSRHDAQRPADRLDVFYVGLDYAQPYTDPARDSHWNDAFGVVHAQWTSATDWRLARIPDLTAIAARSGVAATRDTAGTIHLLVQRRDRSGLRHATLAATTNAAWSIAAGPGPIPPDQDRPCWWMSLYLVAFPDRLIGFGITNIGTLAWAVYAQDRWSAVTTDAVRFSTTRPLAYARRGTTALDLVGVSETGEVAARALVVGQDGIVRMNNADGLPP